MEFADAADLMDLSEKTKPVMEVLNVAMNSVCYKYDPDFRNLEDRYEATAGGEPAELVYFRQLDHLYNARRPNALEITSDDLLEPNDIEDFYDLAKN